MLHYCKIAEGILLPLTGDMDNSFAGIVRTFQCGHHIWTRMQYSMITPIPYRQKITLSFLYVALKNLYRFMLSQAI